LALIPPVQDLRGFFDGYPIEIKVFSRDPDAWLFHHWRSGMEGRALPAQPTRVAGKMPIGSKLPAAKIVDLVTQLESEPVTTAAGPVLWANVEILYTSESLTPRVSIRVPLPWSESDTEPQRKDLALRFARQLIDHACVAMGTPAAEAPAGVADAGTVLEGLSQELGLVAPTTRPLRKRRG
jgi:hypothetical protein